MCLWVVGRLRKDQHFVPSWFMLSPFRPEGRLACIVSRPRSKLFPRACVRLVSSRFVLCACIFHARAPTGGLRCRGSAAAAPRTTSHHRLLLFCGFDEHAMGFLSYADHDRFSGRPADTRETTFFQWAQAKCFERGNTSLDPRLVTEAAID